MLRTCSVNVADLWTLPQRGKSAIEEIEVLKERRASLAAVLTVFTITDCLGTVEDVFGG